MISSNEVGTASFHNLSLCECRFLKALIYSDLASNADGGCFRSPGPYSLPEWSTGSYAEALLRYDVSFAGDPSRRNVSNLQLAPMLNINLPDHWFVTLYPNTEIRINYGDPIPGQTGRLFLPVDFLVGRNVTKTVTLSLEVSVPVIKDYPVYNFRSVTRINMQF